MDNNSDPGANRLRVHYQREQAKYPPKRLQSDVVRDYRGDIIDLISNYGATLAEVAAAVRAQGEPVLDPGFKAEILKQIGKTKDIRLGKAKGALSHKSSIDAPPKSTPSVSPPASTAIPTEVAEGRPDDDEGLFAARRTRG